MAVDGAGVRSCLGGNEIDEEGAGDRRRHPATAIRPATSRRSSASTTAQIGDIVRRCVATGTSGLWLVKDRAAGWTDLEYQMRNWYYFTWLSGDHIVEQHVHNIDVVNWVMNAPSGAVRRPGRPAGAHRARSTATSTITSPSTTSIRTACTS